MLNINFCLDLSILSDFLSNNMQKRYFYYSNTLFTVVTTVLIRPFVCNTKRPSVKQSMKWQVSSNLADEPTLADVLPSPPPIQNCLTKK